jgi:hypothetical protein
MLRSLPRLPRLRDHHETLRRAVAYVAALLQRLRSMRAAKDKGRSATMQPI